MSSRSVEKTDGEFRRVYIQLTEAHRPAGKRRLKRGRTKVLTARGETLVSAISTVRKAFPTQIE